jgi:aryl-alcohol dehydrogenase-like predicted oxidoreductase
MDFNEHTLLGRTNLKVKKLGLSGGFGIPAKAVEKAYHEFGINYFHWSTRKPGMKEGLRNLARTERENMVIALQSYDHLGLYLTRSVEQGLKKLKIDSADVLILGWHGKMPPKLVLKTAEKLKKRGLIRFLAVSGHKRLLFGRLAQRADSPFDIFMTRYNAVHKGAEEEIFPFLPQKNRPGLTTYTATCWGRLLDPKRMPPNEEPLSAAECYRFVLSTPIVDLTLFGPKTEEEMGQALLAFRDGPLSDKEMLRIRRIGDHLHMAGKKKWYSWR